MIPYSSQKVVLHEMANKLLISLYDCFITFPPRSSYLCSFQKVPEQSSGYRAFVTFWWHAISPGGWWWGLRLQREFLVKVLFLLSDSWSIQTGQPHGWIIRWSQLPCHSSAPSLTWGQWVQKWSYFKMLILTSQRLPLVRTLSLKKDWTLNKHF